MDANIQAQLQFLNLEDVDANEAEYLQNVLYSGKSPTLELPWVDTEELAQAEWPQHPQYDGQPNEIVDTGGGGEMYQMSVPVATTMQQMYHNPVVPQMPSVTYVSNMPHPNYHPGLSQPPPPPFQGGPPQQMYPAQMPTGPGRQRGSKQSPKRGGGRDGAPAGAYASVPPQGYPTHHTYPPPMHHHVPFPCIPNTPTPHFPTAQHAAGPPLYIAPSIPMYHPQHIYHHNYAPVFSPIAQQQPPEEMKQMEYSVEKVDPVPPAQLPQQPPHNVYMPAQVAPPPLMDEPPAPASSQPPAPKDEHHQHHYHQPQQQPQLQPQLHHSEAPPPEETEVRNFSSYSQKFYNPSTLLLA